MVATSKVSTPTVTVLVELFGQARILSGHRQVEIAVPEHADADDLAAVLALACPELLGKVMREDGSSLQDSYTFNLNGTAFVGNENLHLTAGDSLLLFSSQAGG
tara:strand:+ start:129 stop:440 length:312 start_codon:yes stop_codon:yes gene_type:complete